MLIELAGCMKVLIVIGTRPEAIKMAPVIRELRCRGDIFEVVVCLTAQHREMLDQVIELFEISVDHDLDLMEENQTIFQVTSRILLGLERVLAKEKPDVVLVHGDTTTSFAAALAAFYLHIPVGHVEAGMRTYDKHRPFPEEMNRRLSDDLCDYHYAATLGCRENLLREHVPEEHIVVTGNSVIDALIEVSSRPFTFSDPLLAGLGIERRLLLVTAHRRESFGGPFRQMLTAVRDLAAQNEDMEVLFPVHPNPHVRETADEILVDCARVHLVSPLDYQNFVHLLKKSTIVLTDSGGIQEEAPSLGKPVLVMREVTERPEGIDAGTCILVGTQYETICDEVQHLLDDRSAYAEIAQRTNPYGDGTARLKIADHLQSLEGSRR